MKPNPHVSAAPPPQNVEELAALVVDQAFRVHTSLGPGLVEAVYETVLAHKLRMAGLHVDMQRTFPITVDGIVFKRSFRVDLLVNRTLVIEVKSREFIALAHKKQLLTYLRLLKLPIGLLLNFGAGTFKEGIRRIVNGHIDTSSSTLRIHQTEVAGSREGEREDAKGSGRWFRCWD